jgi:hypothetical protein
MRQNGSEEGEEEGVGGDDKNVVPVERQRPAYKADTLLVKSLS